MGDVNYDVYRWLHENLPDQRIAYEGVQYAAGPVLSFTDPSLASTPGSFISNAKAGGDWMAAEVGLIDARCKHNTKFVLSGYSQGAWATHRALHQMSSALRKQVAAVTLFGDPLYKPFQSINKFNNNLNVSFGIASVIDSANAVVPKDVVPRTGSWCKPLDPVCQPPSVTINPHLQYVTDGHTVDAGRFAKTMIPAPRPWTTISSGLPVKGYINKSYSFTFAATSGVGTVTWSRSGTLPAGLNLSTTGKLTGTPMESGEFEFTVKAVDSIGRFDKATHTLRVEGPLTILNDMLTCAVVNQPYQGRLAADGGVAPYTWAITSGALPAGLSLNSQTGDVTGTPTSTGTSTFTTRVTDSARTSMNKSVTADVKTDCTPAPAGTIEAWGFNAQGQLGNGTWNDGTVVTNTLTPVDVKDLTDVVQISAGGWFSLAVDKNGALWAWGRNSEGQLGLGTTDAQSTSPQRVGLLDIKSVAAGEYHGLAIRGDGTVFAWGRNDYGQLGDGTTTNSVVPVIVNGLPSAIKAVSAGYHQSLALATDGSVWAWGTIDGTDTLVVPQRVVGLSNITAIAAGSDHNLALGADGSVWAWGNNARGQLGIGDTVFHPEPVKVPGISDAKAIAAGSEHSLAVRSGGSVLGWGRNQDGELGTGNVTSTASPIPVLGLSAAVSVSAGLHHSVAVRSDGSVWAWGILESVGVANGANALIPSAVNGLSGIRQVDSGRAHILALHT